MDSDRSCGQEKSQMAQEAGEELGMDSDRSCGQVKSQTQRFMDQGPDTESQRHSNARQYPSGCSVKASARALAPESQREQLELCTANFQSAGGPQCKSHTKGNMSTFPSSDAGRERRTRISPSTSPLPSQVAPT